MPAVTRAWVHVPAPDDHGRSPVSRHLSPAPEAVIEHTNLYWRFQSAPGRTAGTVATVDVDFAAAP